MTNALFGFNNRALTGTLTASAAAAGLGPDQLATPHGATSSSWQTPAGTTTAWARLDAGSAVEWGAVALTNTNLTPAATVRWRLSDDANFAVSPVWDTGAVPVVAAGYRQAVAVEPAALQASTAINRVRNARGAGAVAGTPGTLPTHWATILAAPATLTQTVVGTGVEAGVGYVEIAFTINNSAGGGTASLIVYPEPNATGVAAAVSQAWTGSWFASVVGTPTNIASTALNLRERNGGSTLATTTQAVSLTGSLSRYTVTRNTNQATTNNVNCNVLVTVAAGLTGTITLRLGWPQIELGATATPPSLPPALARYLRVDIADPGNPAGFLRAAQLYGGPVARPIGNIGYETAFARTVDAPALTTRGGQEFPILRHTRRGWRISMPSLREAEVWPLVDALQLAAADGRNVLFIPFPAGADIQRDAVFGRLTDPAPITWPNPTPLRRAWSCTITERL
jgi:hypothetical protein